MDNVRVGSIDALPDEAVLLMTITDVLRVSVTLLIGRIECDEVRIGDRVAAVGERPICQGVVGPVERFLQMLPRAGRGEVVGVGVYGWAKFPLERGCRLYLIPRENAEPFSRPPRQM